MAIQFNLIEQECKDFWQKNEIYKVDPSSDKPKFYVLDMFPYPSGSGLHVGHPLGYIASDIIARSKRMKAYNVLHPMGFDAFGLPAEQYAIQTGVHPAHSTSNNIARYKEQLANIGFNYDWTREVNTSDPSYYKWTQWIFLQLYQHYYDFSTNQARPIQELIQHFEKFGNSNLHAANSFEGQFDAEQWKSMNIQEKDKTLMNFRLAYRKESFVNWCEALGTVLANDEITNGVSERGGHPVVKKSMMQWSLRISAYAERLLNDLQNLDWSPALKTMQQNWIGKSVGAQLFFKIADQDSSLEIYTTRPDTIFGVSFMVIAPEHPFVDKLTKESQLSEVEKFKLKASQKSEIERQAEIKNVDGVFTGSYAIHPFTGKEIPIWISDYVLIEYGTGAIMSVPGHDQRDRNFAEKFNLPIKKILDQSEFASAGIEDRVGTLIDSEFLNGMDISTAIQTVVKQLESKSIGTERINYKMRDANFSRQRYWGEPFPIVYDQQLCYALDEKQLPIILPNISNFQPASDGTSPLSRNEQWVNEIPNRKRETDTMPGYAGSSWYFLRYMDPTNSNQFASSQALQYWQDVDLYIGGTEHAVGHLMYSRFWHKFLFDLKLVPTNEPFKKLVNQGMIQGEINRIYMMTKEFSHEILIYADARLVTPENKHQYIPVEVPLSIVKKDAEGKSYLSLDSIIEFYRFRSHAEHEKIKLQQSSDDRIYLISEIGKMSKRYHNVVNPDDVVAEYGADCFRMYEMFLGPLEQSKPWDTKGISGVSNFIRKFCSLALNEHDELILTNEDGNKEELKILHSCIKKVNQDLDHLSFNTSVSAFMICVNELRRIDCRKKSIFLELCKLMAPFAPFITEFFWQKMGQKGSIHHADYPQHSESFLESDSVNYPISINGKKRMEWQVSKSLTKEELETQVVLLDELQKYIGGQTIQRMIIVPGRMINIVI